VTRPEEALAVARAEAARKRAAGGYANSAAAGLDGSIVSAHTSFELLSRWAVIQGDPELLYSTRRAGAPVTALKRFIVRMLRQYLVEIEARQTRFNIALLASVQELERRTTALERRADAVAGKEPEGGSTDVPA
jgi:hypothetical protein